MITEREQKMIDECLDYLDFEKVQKVMTFLDWKWGNIHITGGAEVPSIPEMRKSARRYLKMAIEGSFGHPQYMTGSGGFMATAYRDRGGYGGIECLHLEFVLTDWTAENEG